MNTCRRSAAHRATFVLLLTFPWPSIGGDVPMSAKYYFTESTVQGDLAGCANVTIFDWTTEGDEVFVRVGSGARYLVGVITYTNLTCGGTTLNFPGNIQSTVHFKEPIFSTNPVFSPLCAPFAFCFLETGSRQVLEFTGSEPFQITLTPNETGTPRGDADSISFPSAAYFAQIPEGESASFFWNVQFNSPIATVSLVAADGVGFVTESADPLSPIVAPSVNDLMILRVAGAQVPMTPTQRLSMLGGFAQGVGPGRSLASKIAAAEAYLSVGDVDATCAVMDGLVSEVNAQYLKKIDQAVASIIVTDAQQLMDQLNCG